MSAFFSQVARDYFAAHAIDPEVAAAFGVREEAGHLRYPYSAADGSRYYRERPLSGAGQVKAKQPRGQPLELWCPLGPLRNEAVIVCEGESDALAAIEPLSESRYSELLIVAIPGTGFPPTRLANRLAQAGVREVFLALDGDDAGRSYSVRAVEALDAAGIAAIRLELGDGTDLADNLARAEDRAAWIENALADAEASAATLGSRWIDSSADGSQPAPGNNHGAGARKLRRLDVARMVSEEPEPPPWVIEDLVVEGMLTVLARRARARACSRRRSPPAWPRERTRPGSPAVAGRS